MTPASIDEIKKGLSALPAKKIMDLTLRLVRFKKENKELLTYLLFESGNEAGYVESIKIEMNEQFTELPKATVYLTKKSLRKILRMMSKQSKYMSSKTAAIDLLLHFCVQSKERGLSSSKHSILHKIYQQQIAKIEKLLPALDEDLQYDYMRSLNSLD